jgi:adenosylhomocysteinase
MEKQLKQHFNESDHPFLTRQIDELSSYKELSVINNTPLAMSVGIKLLPFSKNSIETFASGPIGIPVSSDAIDMLNSSNIKYFSQHDELPKADIILDCCGDLINHKASAYAELTQSGSKKYQEFTDIYRILDVDNTKLKFLEDYYGTGDGFIRALNKSEDFNFSNKSFLIIGFGKVGKGIAKALEKEKARKIFVIESDLTMEKDVTKLGYIFIDGKDLAEMKQILNNIDVVVTATGVKNLLEMQPYSEIISESNALLANMGAHNEYGNRFSSTRLLNNGAPLNFTLFEPTKLKYLDPIFYYHNKCLEFFASGKLNIGLNEFRNLENEIITEWSKIWSEDISILENFYTS